MLQKTGILITTVFLILSAGNSGYETQTSPLLFYHEKTTCPELIKLRASYNYDEFCSKGKSEFEQMLLLREWVFKKIKYEAVFDDINLRNSLEILDSCKNKKTFLCTAFSAVMMQCALSMGWTSRYIFLKKPGPQIHAGVDIWSNQFCKWIYFDPSWNIHLEKNRIPLSIIEIRDEWIKNNGRDMTFVFSTGKNRRSYNFKDYPVDKKYNELWSIKPISDKWFSYTFHIAVVGRNNFFTHNDGSGRDIWDLIYIIKDDLNSDDTSWSLLNRTAVSNMKTLFHGLNMVSINLNNHASRKNTISIHLEKDSGDSYTPNFSHFEIRINKGKWKKSSDQFIIKAGKSPATLSARTVNLSGVKGPASKIIIPPIRK